MIVVPRFILHISCLDENGLKLSVAERVRDDSREEFCGSLRSDPPSVLTYFDGELVDFGAEIMVSRLEPAGADRQLVRA